MILQRGEEYPHKQTLRFHCLLLSILQRSYLATVLKEIRSSQKDESENIHVRLLVSIDRRKGVEDAEDTLAIIQEFRAEYGDLLVGNSTCLRILFFGLTNRFLDTGIFSFKIAPDRRISNVIRVFWTMILVRRRRQWRPDGGPSVRLRRGPPKSPKSRS